MGDVLQGAMAGVSTEMFPETGDLPEIRFGVKFSLRVDGADVDCGRGPFYGSLNDIEPEDIESITVFERCGSNSYIRFSGGEWSHCD